MRTIGRIMKKVKFFLAGLVCLGSIITLCLVLSHHRVFASKSINRALPVAATMHATVTTVGCSNNPGPYITLTGELTIASVNAQLIFKNNEKGTHKRSEDVTVEVNLMPEQTIKFAKQPPQGGVGGNPWCYFQAFNEYGEPISHRVLLGRCVQGLSPVSMDFIQLADVAMEIGGYCSNSPGPYITPSGDMSFEGVYGVMTFQNKRGNAPHVREEAVDIEMTIIPAGGSIQFAKGWE